MESIQKRMYDFWLIEMQLFVYKVDRRWEMLNPC